MLPQHNVSLLASRWSHIRFIFAKFLKNFDRFEIWLCCQVSSGLIQILSKNYIRLVSIHVFTYFDHLHPDQKLYWTIFGVYCNIHSSSSILFSSPINLAFSAYLCGWPHHHRHKCKFLHLKNILILLSLLLLVLPPSLPTLHLKWKSLVNDSPEKLQHVLETINPNWFCPWSPFCCTTSLSPKKLHLKRWNCLKCINDLP